MNRQLAFRRVRWSPSGSFSTRVEALRTSLAPEPPSPPSTRLSAAFKCTPSQWDYARSARKVKLSVNFAAAPNGRAYERQAQTREAMELLNMLAVGDNSAFKEMLSAVTGNGDHVSDTLEVCPIWECLLVGTLESHDPASSVTWVLFWVWNELRAVV